MLHATSIDLEPPASARWSGCTGGTTVSGVGVAMSGMGVAVNGVGVAVNGVDVAVSGVCITRSLP